MQLFELWTNADVYNDPWRAQVVSDWTAQVEISRDILQMTVSDRPACEKWGITYKQSGFALVGHVTREAMQTDAMKEHDIIRYFGVIDNDFNLANRDVYYLYPDDTHVNDD